MPAVVLRRHRSPQRHRPHPPMVKVQGTLDMDTHVTRVYTMRIPGIRHVSVRFGKPAQSTHSGRGQRVHYFEPHAVFGLLRWYGNEYGTTYCEFSVLRAVAPQEAVSPICGVTPGAEVLLTVSSVAEVRRVLALVREIRAQGIAPSEVSPAYWRAVHHRLMAHVALPEYGAAAHAAYLKRPSCEP